ncbi:hypothetical protein NI17_022145 [Thermobifida halotolerans]|uniref:Uncharacterized protein n=1 Tax=Thermobifida halotolerans TaxID=483545 RepID=A0AA97LWD4_9ACTN|nr:hypothetical protein [Thermobifida halotolerans]UOE19392.1 hypothetical protein NI17_022145 [Thermobifida halotolerans]
MAGPTTRSRSPLSPLVIVLMAIAALLAAVLVAVVAVRFVGARAVVVTGVIGSEKEPFFANPEVRARFAELGYTVEVRTAGSRAIATTDLTGYDFGFPGSTSSAEKLKAAVGVDHDHQPFHSPMVILTRQPVIESLVGAELVTRGPDGVHTFDMAAYLELTGERTRWRDLPGGGGFGSANRNEVLVRTTDPRSSNSAAMYLAVVSYLLNGEKVVTDPDTETLDEAARLFLAQGDPPQTSQQPFDHFLALGAGHTPLLWAYEAQYVSAAVNLTSFPEDVVMLYPAPTTISHHTLVPLTEEGDEVGRLLVEDPELQRLAALNGFRPSDPAQFTGLADRHAIPVPAQVTDVVNAPSHGVLEQMLSEIEDRYTADGAAAPAADVGELPDVTASPRDRRDRGTR